MPSDTAGLDRVRTIVANVMQVPLDQVTATSSPDTIKEWDSLHHLNLVLALEESFALQFSPEETIQLLNVETIALLIREKLQV